MALTLEERETHIYISRTDETAEIYTSDERYMRKFDKLVEDNPEEWKFKKAETVQGEVIGKTYSCPRNLISFRSKTQKRELTEEQRQAAADRLREMRNKAQR